MRRPKTWLRLLFLLSLLLALVEYLAVSWLAPYYVMRAVERATGGQAAAERTELVFPFTTVLTNLHLTNNSPQAAITIQRLSMRLRWVSLPTRTLYVDRVVLEQPIARLSRGPGGTIFWPAFPQLGGARNGRPAWHLQINTLRIVDGTIEVLDEQPMIPFHGLLDHVALELGPMRLPLNRTSMSFAARGQLVGSQGHAAPAYCSGWIGLLDQDLEATCRVEPIPLAAFEPYYHGRTELRVYTTTLASTSQWTARGNQLDGRVQLELANIGEGDLSIRGRTILDLKRTGLRPQRLRAEIHLSGLLDQPRGWQGQFLPDEPVQQLVQRLLDRGVETIKISLPGSQVRMSITPPNQTTSGNIEAVTKEVDEALELLASPPEEEAPPAAAAAPPPAAPADSPPSASPEPPDVAAPGVIR